MSVTCSCLLLFLLCLSLHACNARRLGSIDTKIPQVRKSLFLNKDHKLGKTSVDEITVSKVLEFSSLSSSKEKGDENTLMKAQTEEIDHKNLKEIRKTSRGILSKDQKIAGIKAGSVSVSWRVPHKKRGEKQPGFNLDYSPPKTHPPSHN